ncbi:VIT family protein [Terricaulis sp.]|uniref:VIT family protein n=1 Tax=Terricaulis sp. TaxID=2768686 RepID=UPI003782D8DD
MARAYTHLERHQVTRIGWLRASVLGANDGIVSTASLLAGVASAGADKNTLIVTGIAALAAGALSMAAGEYVSVSSQADSEQADLARETRELETDVEAEHEELTNIYVGRGLDQALAAQVATQLMAKDALGAHARDELGISEITAARPVQAALASAAAFSVGALLPLLVAIAAPRSAAVASISIAAIAALALLGALGARAGRADMLRSVLRVVFWGALALIVTSAIGALVGPS